ncbi:MULTISPECIES: hypothetical protein [unclassified Nonomuraea]|uniref:hypothetical protein n=1 Tax=unclassified Nonomuraea TaxID=2593643 RepID=UPI0033ECC2CB
MQLVDPAPPAPADPPCASGGRKLYNQWGQYLLPDPDTGKERSWVRATTLAKALEDTYNLEVWGMRMVAKGMALRPDLLALAASLDVEADKKRLNQVAKDAKEAAGGSSGANMGTALHAMTEKLDAGEEVSPGPFARELAAYRATMAAEGLTVLPRYSERIICVPSLDVAGRLDKLTETVGSRLYQVSDLKSQKSMDFGGVSIAIQLSLYAHAYAMWDPATETWEDPPPIDQETATVVWLPVGRGHCEVFDVDIFLGWEWAKHAMETRRIRKCKPLSSRGNTRPATLEPPRSALQVGLDEMAQEVRSMFPAIAASSAAAKKALERPRPTMYGDAGAWALVFKDAKTVEELIQAGQEAAADLGGQLPDTLKDLGRKLRQELLAKESTPRP